MISATPTCFRFATLLSDRIVERVQDILSMRQALNLSLSRLTLMASLLGSRYEVGRDVFSSVMAFFESTTLRSRSSDSRRSLLLVGSDSVAFSTCSEASSLGSRSGIIAICTNSDGLHKIIHADWLKKSPQHFYTTYICSAISISFTKRLRCLARSKS
jgi:hypothetical protein